MMLLAVFLTTIMMQVLSIMQIHATATLLQLPPPIVTSPPHHHTAYPSSHFPTTQGPVSKVRTQKHTGPLDDFKHAHAKHPAPPLLPLTNCCKSVDSGTDANTTHSKPSAARRNRPQSITVQGRANNEYISHNGRLSQARINGRSYTASKTGITPPHTASHTDTITSTHIPTHARATTCMHTHARSRSRGATLNEPHQTDSSNPNLADEVLPPPVPHIPKIQANRHRTTSTVITKRSAGNDTATQAKHDGGSHRLQESNSKASRRRRRRRRKRRRRRGRGRSQDLSLWIDSKQVKMFSGYLMEIFVIHNGRVLSYILDPNFERQLPIIPSQVENVNFTWQAGSKKYQYAFDQLYSEEESLLSMPVLSLPPRGTVPRKPRVFSVNIQCTGNASGIATFSIGLMIQTPQKEPLPGTPLRLKLRKECHHQGPDPECDLKCENGGVCDEGQRCRCPEGYMGQYCSTALCYPQCLNGGSCTTPGRCSCPPGFQGRHCEGGICQNKCQNGGKCVQKDTCACRKGYYGNWCEFSKCIIPCVNGGKCRDVNKCRCPEGFAGNHCEVMLTPGDRTSQRPSSRCLRRCQNGSCRDTSCNCYRGYAGRWCHRRVGRGSGRPKLWV